MTSKSSNGLFIPKFNKCQFLIKNGENAKRRWKERRLFASDEEFIKVQLYLDKIRIEAKENKEHI